MNILRAIEEIDRLVFTTQEIASMTMSSLSSTNQKLRRLEDKGVLGKIRHGIWGKINDRRFGPFLVIPFLSPHHRLYLSFISALHWYGVVSQIPQQITVASLCHTRVINTSVGTYAVHQIQPAFFRGFDWAPNGSYLIATPEKALVDCLYLASRRGRNFSCFPEFEFEGRLSLKKARTWANEIPEKRIQKAVIEKLGNLV